MRWGKQTCRDGSLQWPNSPVSQVGSGDWGLPRHWHWHLATGQTDPKLPPGSFSSPPPFLSSTHSKAGSHTWLQPSLPKMPAASEASITCPQPTGISPGCTGLSLSNIPWRKLTADSGSLRRKQTKPEDGGLFQLRIDTTAKGTQPKKATSVAEEDLGKAISCCHQQEN